MTRLQRLDIHGVRGVRDLSLPFGGGSVVLGGANGTGKSACVDAIELLYTGSIATLTGTQGLSLRQHGAHVRVPAGEALVTAVLSDPDGCVTRRLSGQLDVPADLEGHMERGGHLAFILRRSQLQHFIHAKPADRYRSMADLIGAEALDRTEAGLKSARDAIEQQLLQAQAAQARIDARLAELPEPGDDELLLRTTNERLESIDSAYRLASWDEIRAVRAGVLRSVAAARQDPVLEARARATEELHRGIAGNRLREAIATYREVTARDRPREAHLLDLLHLLRRGRDYLREQPADRCPLCEREMRGRVLFDRLVERVAQLEEVSLHEQRVQGAASDLTRALQETAQRLQSLVPLWAAAGLRPPSGPLADGITMAEESVRAGALGEGRELAARTLQALDRWDTWAGEALAVLEAEKPQPADDEDEGAAAVLALLEEAAAQRAAAERGRQELSRLLEERERIATELMRSDRAFALADRAFRTFNRTKNAEIQRVYDDLRTDLARMYDVLHPGEGHGAVAILMDPRKRGSSDLRMGFYGREDDDPRAFASEGHLDSLGLCIFLAFARRFNGDWPLLVLDDVVATVDAAHKVRVARLLLEEFGDRQLFITTHDSRWFRELQRLQEELGVANVRNLAIESWSLEDGPKIRELTSTSAP